MSRTSIAAHSYPGFVNVTRSNGIVEVTIRAAPTIFNGKAVCGVDCKPKGEGCNGYCLGQQPSSRPMEHVKCDPTVTLAITEQAWRNIVKAAVADSAIKWRKA